VLSTVAHNASLRYATQQMLKVSRNSHVVIMGSGLVNDRHTKTYVNVYIRRFPFLRSPIMACTASRPTSSSRSLSRSIRLQFRGQTPYYQQQILQSLYEQTPTQHPTPVLVCYRNQFIPSSLGLPLKLVPTY